jgi:hypothetical protein
MYSLVIYGRKKKEEGRKKKDRSRNKSKSKIDSKSDS